ncbi:hypothetical protein FGO68_gene1611 [Halteria grandinella]|uniref:Uncharacterized protein n=1 Tax=Halteria grandinella TaxID=5974 RepID=A0A8J8N9F3_HALGN|nr:hypothetical protein FGO68_gene1611 [Halteria grandinella]
MGGGTPGKSLITTRIKQADQICYYSLVNFDSATGAVEWGISSPYSANLFQRATVYAGDADATLVACGKYKDSDADPFSIFFARFQLDYVTFVPLTLQHPNNTYMQGYINQYKSIVMGLLPLQILSAWHQFRRTCRPHLQQQKRTPLPQSILWLRLLLTWVLSLSMTLRGNSMMRPFLLSMGSFLCRSCQQQHIQDTSLEVSLSIMGRAQGCLTNSQRVKDLQ